MTQQKSRITGGDITSLEDLAFATPINCIGQVAENDESFRDMYDLEESIDRHISRLTIPAEGSPDHSKFIRDASLLRNNLSEYRERLNRAAVEYAESRWEEHGKQWYQTKELLIEATVYIRAMQQLESKVHYLRHILCKLQETGFEYLWRNWAILSVSGDPILIPGSCDVYICPVCKTISDFENIKQCKHLVACPSCAFIHQKGGPCINLAAYHSKLRSEYLEKRAKSITVKVDCSTELLGNGEIL